MLHSLLHFALHHSLKLLDEPLNAEREHYRLEHEEFAAMTRHLELEDEQLAKLEKKHGPRHPLLLQPLYACVALRVEAGEWDPAVALLDRAVDIVQATPWEILQRHRCVSAAEAVLERAVSLGKALGGKSQLGIAAAQTILGAFRIQQGRYADAEELLGSALQNQEREVGAEDPRVNGTRMHLATALAAQGRLDEAMTLWIRALALVEKAEGPESPNLVPALCGTAHAHRGLGRGADAESALWRAIAIQKKALGPEHAEVQKLMDALANLYEKPSSPPGKPK